MLMIVLRGISPLGAPGDLQSGPGYPVPGPHFSGGPGRIHFVAGAWSTPPRHQV